MEKQTENVKMVSDDNIKPYECQFYPERKLITKKIGRLDSQNRPTVVAYRVLSDEETAQISFIQKLNYDWNKMNYSEKSAYLDYGSREEYIARRDNFAGLLRKYNRLINYELNCPVSVVDMKREFYDISVSELYKNFINRIK